MRQTRSQARVLQQLKQPTKTTTPQVPQVQIDEVKKDILSLSVEELHTVLAYPVLEKLKKATLRQRCLDLLSTDFYNTKEKVKLVIASRTPIPSTTPTPIHSSAPISLTIAQAHQIATPTTLEIPTVQPAQLSIMYQQSMGMLVGQPTANGTVNVGHTNGGVTVAQYNPTQEYPAHPDVRLKKLAFFDVMATLLKPSTLIPNSPQRIQEGTYYFHLTPQQATDIASNRDVRNNTKMEHVIQVQLRFCLLETSCEQEDYFPPNVVLKVNNKLCALPNPIPTNKPGVEPKRPPRPVNITTNVKLSPTVANHISVSWCTEYARGYVVSAYLVKKLTSTQLLHRMKSKGVKPSDSTCGLIIEKLKEDADCDIATTMLKVSLACPLGKMRMVTPCRASTCSHLQCFDASLYLQMNERKPTWNCPVCDKPAIYENLVIDGYFQEVLASPRLAPDANEIQLHKDGSWSTHVKNDCDIDTPSKMIHKVEVISDDIEVITTTPAKANSNSAMKSTNDPISTSNNPDISSVDLTLSDSDDEAPINNKAPAILPSVMIPAATTVTPVPHPSSANNAKSAAMPPQQIAGSGSSKSNNDISIISLDSPSPPSSPVRLTAQNLSYPKNPSVIEIFSPINNSQINQQIPNHRSGDTSSSTSITLNEVTTSLLNWQNHMASNFS